MVSVSYSRHAICNHVTAFRQNGRRVGAPSKGKTSPTKGKTTLTKEKSSPAKGKSSPTKGKAAVKVDKLLADEEASLSGADA